MPTSRKDYGNLSCSVITCHRFPWQSGTIDGDCDLTFTLRSGKGHQSLLFNRTQKYVKEQRQTESCTFDVLNSDTNNDQLAGLTEKQAYIVTHVCKHSTKKDKYKQVHTLCTTTWQPQENFYTTPLFHVTALTNFIIEYKSKEYFLKRITDRLSL